MVLLLGAFGASEADAEWKVGLAQVKITPERPVPMAGYAARTKPFFFNDAAPPEIYTLSLHDALPILPPRPGQRTHRGQRGRHPGPAVVVVVRSDEHTSELQSPVHLVCCLLLEKK